MQWETYLEERCGTGTTKGCVLFGGDLAQRAATDLARNEGKGRITVVLEASF